MQTAAQNVIPARSVDHPPRREAAGAGSVAVAPEADGSERLYVANFSVALAPLVPPGGAGPGIVVILLSD